jgi:hypothetical protein
MTCAAYGRPFAALAGARGPIALSLRSTLQKNIAPKSLSILLDRSEQNTI